LSSGAAYGATFLAPASAATQAKFPVNALTPQDYYGIAKLHAEARHRAMPNHAIIDIRVFAYFSRHSDIAKRFFVTDMLRAIRDGKEFETGAATMRRDFIAPRDFQALVAAALDGESRNIAIDTYSRAPVEKFALLDAMRDTFDLRYRIVEQPALMIATGAKPEYYSTHRAAAALGYQPLQTALESVLEESSALLGR
jgi:nucleoside-diphosphate-sugar epimerase